MKRIYLASGSPRRRELLQQIDVDFDVVHVDIDETPRPAESVEDLVRRLALAKAEAGKAMTGGDRPVLGADTLVTLDDRVLGKPVDREDGLQMLRQLSGRRHDVLTAVAAVADGRRDVRLSRSRVTFRELSPPEIEAYWATGEPADKAGAYAVQGLGAIFIAHLEGSYSGVMGLPIYETAALLRQVGVRVLQ